MCVWQTCGHLPYQFEHPDAAPAGRQTAKQSKHDDDGSRGDEDVGGVGGRLGHQGEVGPQQEAAPQAHGQ